MLYSFVCFLLFVLLSSVCYTAAQQCSPYERQQRTINGTCNNLLNQAYGSAHTYYTLGVEGNEPYEWADIPIVNPLPPFGNASLLPSSGPRPNARLVSNAIGKRAHPHEEDPLNHSLFSILFGQFINHDMEDNRFNNISVSDNYLPLVTYILDPTDAACETKPYRCNPTDPILTITAHNSGGQIIDGIFNVLSEETAFLDLSGVYGPKVDIHVNLRSYTGGKLKMDNYSVTFPAPPKTFNYTNLIASLATTQISFFDPTLNPIPQNMVFSAGDWRVNENLGLILMHVIWAREHNRICDELIIANEEWRAEPDRFDQQIFDKARALNIAKFQRIVYEQYFPAQFGDHFVRQLGDFKSYNPLVNPSINGVYAFVAFRFGHYTLKPWFAVDKCGNTTNYDAPSSTPMPNFGMTGPYPFPYATPVGVLGVAGSLENVARGLIAARSAPVTGGIDESIRTFNIPYSASVFDLFVLDIQRGRFNQVPNYQRIRTVYHGLDSVTNRIYGLPGCPVELEHKKDEKDSTACFVAITGDVATASTLQRLYKKINNLDAIVGLLVEKHVEGSSIGRTVGNIIVDQYKRARDGDRFFYKHLINTPYFNSRERKIIKQTTMGEILRRNLNEGVIDFENPFLTPPTYISDLAASCSA